MSTTLQRAQRLAEQHKLHPSRHREIVIAARNKELLALKAKMRKAAPLIRALEDFVEARRSLSWDSPMMVLAANTLSDELRKYRAK